MLTRQMADGTIGVRLEITRYEFEQWVAENWHIVELILAAGEIPSIDRVDSDKHYSVDNMQIISFRENCSKAGIATRDKKKSMKNI